MFHRLALPTYFNPPAVDYLNNALSGTPAVADGPRAEGPNAGTRFLGFAENATSQSVNRGLKALGENTDTLDGLFHRDVAIPRVVSSTAVGAVSSFVLAGPVWIGEGGTPNTVTGIQTFIALVDQYDNEIFVGASECQVTAIGPDVPGAVWSAGNLTLTISPAIPDTTAFRVYFYSRGNLASIPEDAFQTHRRTDRYNGGATWADGTTNPATSISHQLDKIISDLAAVTGAPKIGSDAIAGSPYSVAAGTVRSQLVDIYAELNAEHAAMTTAVTSAIATESAARISGDASVSAFIARQPPGLRLTGRTGAPTSLLDTFAGTIYYTPYTSGNIGLYDGTKWVDFLTSEISISVPALGNKIYDVFVYSNAGTPTLELSAAWATDLARTDALARQDGIWVKSSDHTRRYVGSFRTSSPSIVPDTSGARYLFNQYNRITRSAYTNEVGGTPTWTYGSNSWRPANNNSDNSVGILTADPEGIAVTATVVGIGRGTTTFVTSGVGIGVDATNINSADIYGGGSGNSTLGSLRAEMTRQFATGFHTFYWIETADGVNTTTFFGPYSGNQGNTGISVRVQM